MSNLTSMRKLFNRQPDNSVYDPVVCEPYRSNIKLVSLNPMGQLRYTLFFVLKGDQPRQGAIWDAIVEHTWTKENIKNNFARCRKILSSVDRINAEAVRITLLA